MAGRRFQSFRLQPKGRRSFRILWILAVALGLLGVTFIQPFSFSYNTYYEAEANRILQKRGVQAPQPLKQFSPCPASLSFFMPCFDPDIAIKFPKERNEFRERHCPEQINRLRCLIPQNPGYRNPIEWPRSRMEIWLKNVPHTKIATNPRLNGWMERKWDKWYFPGKGSAFPTGMKNYVNILKKYIPLKNGAKVRTALDIGSGVGSFAAYLMDLDVLTVSMAPKDSNQGQIAFVLERGLPGLVGLLATRRLPFPSASFDLIHCGRCNVNFLSEEGQYLLEVDRLLRPGGFLVLSGPPVHWPGLESDWERLLNFGRALCWKFQVTEGSLAIWQKGENQDCLRTGRLEDDSGLAGLEICSNGGESDKIWDVKLTSCVSASPNLTGLRDWPVRLSAPPLRFPLKEGEIRGEPVKGKEDKDGIRELEEEAKEERENREKKEIDEEKERLEKKRKEEEESLKKKKKESKEKGKGVEKRSEKVSEEEGTEAGDKEGKGDEKVEEIHKEVEIGENKNSKTEKSESSGRKGGKGGEESEGEGEDENEPKEEEPENEGTKEEKEEEKTVLKGDNGEETKQVVVSEGEEEGADENEPQEKDPEAEEKEVKEEKDIEVKENKERATEEGEEEGFERNNKVGEKEEEKEEVEKQEAEEENQNKSQGNVEDTEEEKPAEEKVVGKEGEKKNEAGTGDGENNEREKIRKDSEKENGVKLGDKTGDEENEGGGEEDEENTVEEKKVIGVEKTVQPKDSEEDNVADGVKETGDLKGEKRETEEEKDDENIEAENDGFSGKMNSSAGQIKSESLQSNDEVKASEKNDDGEKNGEEEEAEDEQENGVETKSSLKVAAENASLKEGEKQEDEDKEELGSGKGEEDESIKFSKEASEAGHREESEKEPENEVEKVVEKEAEKEEEKIAENKTEKEIGKVVENEVENEAEKTAENEAEREEESKQSKEGESTEEGEGEEENEEESGGEVESKPKGRRQLLAYENGGKHKIEWRVGPAIEENVAEFNKDTRRWHRRLAYLRKHIGAKLTKGTRNVLDVNAGLGSFAANLLEYPLWVMNVVPTSQRNTLPVIFDRGLIGVAHDWCEAFSSYPRSYDFIHANAIRFVLNLEGCNLIDVMVEWDRLLRPGGLVVVRDSPRMLAKVIRVAKAVKWRIKLIESEEGPLGKEFLLIATKPVK